MEALLLQLVKDHWAGITAFLALAYISFVNALPSPDEPFRAYELVYHFLRGLTPVSRLTPPRIPNVQSQENKQ